MTQHAHRSDLKSGESILIEYLIILILLSGITILSSNHNILITNQGNASLTEIVQAGSKSGKRIHGHGHGNILIANQIKADAKQNVKSDLKSEKSNEDAMNDSDKKSENGNVWVRYGIPIGLLLVLLCGLLISIENEMEEKKDSDKELD